MILRASNNHRVGFRVCLRHEHLNFVPLDLCDVLCSVLSLVSVCLTRPCLGLCFPWRPRLGFLTFIFFIFLSCFDHDPLIFGMITRSNGQEGSPCYLPQSSQALKFAMVWAEITGFMMGFEHLKSYNFKLNS